jgi:hypothetical protein
MNPTCGTEPPATDRPSQPDTSNLAAYTEVRESDAPGVGLGLFATRCLPRGTVWWRATPTNVLHVTSEQLACLKASELARSPASQDFLEAIETFGYLLHGDEPGPGNSIVLTLDNGRFTNHAEVPSSGSAAEDPINWSATLVDVAPGDEITEDYRSYGGTDWYPQDGFLNGGPPGREAQGTDGKDG